MPEANELLLGVGIALNKTEFDNAFDHFPGAREGELDAISFSEALAAPASTGAEPRFFDSKGVAIPQAAVWRHADHHSAFAASAPSAA